MSTTTNITIAANTTQTLALQSWSSVRVIIFSNSTQYDVQWSGFGTQGVLDIPAGMQWKFDSSVYNSGQISITTVDNLNVGGAGPVSITSYLVGEPIPQGTWPVAIPAQRVITPLAGSVVADHLINLGNPASASPIINIQEAGSTGSQMQADNQGNLIVSDYTASVLRTLLRVIAGAGAGASNVLLGNLGNNTEILGYLLADQDATFLRNVTLQNSNVSHVNTFESFSGGAQLSFVGNSNPAINFQSHSGATHILTGAGMIQAVGGQNLTLDTTDNTHIINLRNFGNAVLQVAASLITALQPIAPNVSAFATLNGSVSGTVTFFMPFQGSGFKFVYVFWNNYQDASNRSVALPVQLNNFQYYIQSDIGVAGNGGVQFLNNVTAQPMNVMITIGSAGGTGASVTSVYKYSVGSLNTATPVDHINILSSTGPHTASMQIIGV